MLVKWPFSWQFNESSKVKMSPALERQLGSLFGTGHEFLNRVGRAIWQVGQNPSPEFRVGKTPLEPDEGFHGLRVDC